MRANTLSLGLKIVLLISAASLLVSPMWAASERKLHFGISSTDGINPYPLIFDAAGNLYGTTL